MKTNPCGALLACLLLLLALPGLARAAIDDPDRVLAVEDAGHTVAAVVPRAAGVAAAALKQSAPRGRYVMTTTDVDHTCVVPFANRGAYLDLAAFGITTLSAISGDGWWLRAFASGAPIQYWGNDFQGLDFSDDGVAMFGAIGIPGAHRDIPDPADPNNLLAMFWFDWEVVYQEAGNRGVSLAFVFGSDADGGVIIEFDDVQPLGDPTQTIDFEIFMWRTPNPRLGRHDIIFAYDNINLDRPITLGSIGIENALGTEGVRYAYDDIALETLTNGMAICFDWHVPSADLSISLIGDASPVVAGTAISFTATLANAGPDDVAEASFDLSLPAGLIFLSATPSAGGACSGTSVVTCSWSDVSAGGTSPSATISALVPASASGELTAVAAVEDDGSDPDPSNNSASVVVEVAISADLAITLGASPTVVTFGETLVYLAEVQNSGPSDAQDVSVAMPLPAGTSFVSATPSAGGGCSGESPVLCSWVGASGPSTGRSANIVVTVDGDATGPLVTTAHASSNSSDPNLVNNAATTSTVLAVNGVCGTSHGGIFTSAPADNLCSAGSPTPLLGSGPWSWSCAGLSGGTTAECSADMQTHTLTYSADANGTISGSSPQTVAHGSGGTAVTAVPNSSYSFAQWNDGSTVNPRTDRNVVADITVTAQFSQDLLPANGFLAFADGSAVVPAVVSDGNGEAALSVIGGGGRIAVSLSFGLLQGDAIAAHIHGPAEAGFGGPVIFDLQPVPGSTAGEVLYRDFALSAGQLADLRDGLWYIDVHTSAHPAGEIRGQFEPGRVYEARLSGAQEVPAVAGSGFGQGRVIVDKDRTLLWAQVLYHGLGSALSHAHVHGPAARGENAGVLLDLEPTVGATSGDIRRFASTAGLDLTALGQGLWYFNLHSNQVPGGEIRGQIDLIFHAGFEPAFCYPALDCDAD
jgi:uncharacterized repeat protein (TIGR01451 family)